MAGLLVVLVFLSPDRRVAGASLLAQEPGVAATVDQLSPILTGAAYEAFIALDPPERLDHFKTLDPESKAYLFRTHAERYLQANRARWSAVKIAFLEDHIAHMTPAVYRTPDDPEILRRGEELYHARMECALTYHEIQGIDVLGQRGPEGFSLLEAFWTWWDCARR